MSIQELSNELKKMYNTAKYGEAKTMIHLFGIKYAKEILDNSFNVKEIIKKSGLHDSYLTELYNGIRLSKYVIIID